MTKRLDRDHIHNSCNIFKQKYKYFFNLSTQVPEENEKSTIKRPKVFLEIIVVKSRAKMTY